MANPLAAAVSLASIDLLLHTAWAADVARIGAGLRAGLAGAREVPGVADVRVLGAIGVIEMHTPVDLPKITALMVERGVWARPFGRLVYVMPPFVICDDDLHQLTTAMVEAVGKA
jgi:adenosylmethionine---8-amino-7-oxononanoate aminotransferase